MAQRVLDISNLRVSLATPLGELEVVQGIDLHVARGETLCIVGESGCGKSMTALSIMDLLPANACRLADRLELDGMGILNIGERRMSDLRGNRMGMIFQEPMTSLNPSYTIGDQLMEALRRHRQVSRREACDRAVYLLDKVGIPGARDRLGQYPHQLSGGLRQRVMIALALMCEPDLIIADEPTTALDVTIQAQILALLKELQREFDVGLLLITHDLGIVARIADRVAVMYAGQVVEQGSVAQVFGQPTHPYTQGLLDCVPVPGKLSSGAPLGQIPGMVPSLLNRLPGCHFAGRCAYAGEDCEREPVMLHPGPGRGQAYRCLLTPEVSASNRDRQRGVE